MGGEKRFAKTLAVGACVVLLACTVVSQVIYWRMLPDVRAVKARWQDTGFVLPQGAVFAEPQGTCVYCIEEKEGRFGPKYLLRAVLVTVEETNEKEGEVTVRGIYQEGQIYASDADAPLRNGAEVKVVPYKESDME